MSSKRRVIVVLVAGIAILLSVYAWHWIERGQTRPTAVLPTPEATISPVATGLPSPTPDEMVEKRHEMVKLIEDYGIKDENVLRAVEAVPRERFVLPKYVNQAYADHALPIGYGQTISQPSLVAMMTELLRLRSDSGVLEIGTGSGYQAAILAELVQEVYTVEIVEELCVQAKERLTDLGYDNIQIKHGDGYYGWEEHAPYDAIIVTCAPDHIPQPLVKQLADGGHMVIPVGPPGAYQVLWLVTREGKEVKSEGVKGVVFVPLTGEH